MFGAEQGIRPAALGQCRRQPGELKNRPPGAFWPRCAPPFPSNPFLFHYINKKSTLIGYFFVWRRERDSSGGTGAVPPPARGTKKTSTGRFFASLRSTVPFESLPLSLHKQKKHPYWVLFCLAQRKGFEPLLRFPVNTISSRAPSTSSAISASRSNIIQHFFVHCKRNLILRIKIV